MLPFCSFVYRDYTNTVCWVSNTYYLSIDTPITKGAMGNTVERGDKLVSYYQWVPLILMVQACMAFVPCLIWRFLNRRSG